MSEYSKSIAWIVCMSAGLYFFYEFSQMAIFNSISSDLLKDLAISPVQLGFLSSFYFYAVILLVFPIGILVDHYSARRLILITFCLSLLGTLGLSFSHHLWLAALSRFLSGIGHSFSFLLPMALIMRWFPKERQSLAVGGVVTLGMLGGIFAQLPFVLINNALGWRHAIQVFMGLGIIFLGIIFYQVKDAPQEPAIFTTGLTPSLLWQKIMQVIHSPQNWLCGIYTSFINLPIVVLASLWGNIYLTQAKSLSKSQASFTISMIFIGMIFGNIVMGGVARRWPHTQKTLMITSALFSVGILLVIMSVSVALPFLFLILGILGSVQILSYPIVFLHNDAKDFATATGLVSVLIMASAAIFQPLFGKIIEWYNPSKLLGGENVYSVSSLNHAMLTMVFAFIVAAILAGFIRTIRDTP